MTAFKHIACVGKMHSGKSTLARLLVEDHGYTRIGLADAVKKSATIALDYWLGYWGIPRSITVDEINRNKSVFRPLLQWLGTDWAREYIGPDDFWIKRFLSDVKSCGDDPVVCDDVRFVNEAEALWDAGFMVVRVVRPEADRMLNVYESGDTARDVHSHASEMEQDGIEPYLTVPNDKGLDELRGHTERLVEIMEDPDGWVPRV